MMILKVISLLEGHKSDFSMFLNYKNKKKIKNVNIPLPTKE
jgi:hypothetical protein